MQSGGLSNVFGQPMYMVNDGLYLDLNNYDDDLDWPKSERHYNNINGWLNRALIYGDRAVNTSTGYYS